MFVRQEKCLKLEQSDEFINTFIFLFYHFYNVVKRGGYVMLKRYIGSKFFYFKVIRTAIPLGLQQLVTSCMGIVDSLMVAWIGQVSAVGTAVQIETLCTSVSWACAAGVGIFSVQFFGANDMKNLKKSFGLSLLLGIISGLFWMLLAGIAGEWILGFYIDDHRVVSNGLIYLNIAKYAYIPLSLGFVFNIIYRNINKAHIPLYIGIISMIINIIVNYVLIFGKFGMPVLGIKGAAIATVVAHTTGLIINLIYAYHTKQPFIGGFKEMFSLDLSFIKTIMIKTQSIIFNELLFGFGSTLFIKAFGILGTNAMDAYYVAAKISDIFYAFANGFSNAMAAITGNSLGSGNIKKARIEGDYFVSMAFVLSLICMTFIYMFSTDLVSLFHLSDLQTINQAIIIVKVFAFRIALRFFIVIIFSSLRAGGDSIVLMLLDSGLMYVVGIPLAFLSVHILEIQSIAIVFLLCQLEQVVRLLLGMKRYNSGKWAVNLTTLISKS